MTWLAPWALAAAGAAAVGVGLLHLLARDRPPRWLLPTARFVVPGTARATRRARTPRDLVLLALRMFALLLAGAAFAGPVRDAEGGSIARVVLLDRVAAMRDPAVVRAARGVLRSPDRLVLFDTAAHAVAPGSETAVLDSLQATDSAAARGAARSSPPSLSAGLAAGIRAGTLLAADADSVAIAVVSPLLGVEDAATRAIRALWPGRIDVVRVSAIRVDSVAARGFVRGAAGDPVVVAARLAGVAPAPGALPADRGPADATSLLVRDGPRATDSAFARAGGTLVVWVAGDTAAGAAGADTIGGFVTAGGTALSAIPRGAPPPAGRVVARWIDGGAAATELPFGDGCIRTVAIGVPTAGDLPMRPTFQRALRDMLAPCAAAPMPAISDALRAELTAAGPLAGAAPIRRDSTRSPIAPWLLAVALLLLLGEPLLRRPVDPSA